MRKRREIIKILDPKPELSKGGRLDAYWKDRGFDDMFKSFRPGFKIPRDFNISFPQDVAAKFKLNGFEFGNWVTIEDRQNYLAALSLALIDLNTVLNFNNNLGLDKTIGVAFGARGASHAMAHFEPHSFMINLTRYQSVTKINKIRYAFGQHPLPKGPQTKKLLFEKTGGIGSFAHEYGHALDYFFGTYIHQDKKYRSLTLGRSTATRFDNPYLPDSLRYFALKVIEKIIWSAPGIKSNYYTNLEDKFKDNEYWFRHTELFARAFEVYINYKCQSKGIKNYFLTHTKYNSAAYLKEADFNRVLPWMNKLVLKMSEKAIL